MNVNMKHLCSSNLQDIKNSINSIKEYDYEDSRDSEIAEHISDTTENMEQSLSELEWMHDSLQGFLQELKERKSEGEVIIDELLTVLSIK